ncbi:hypothetical protein [Chondrinema litorale]|uniref:hypothetical protein n=1 Tax=Chondrinema litorale TaxID=2994555 RepID=UPI00254302DB|nr:hypothetical protein [Chondrinema litorale]UZR97702.1 hypothetical protein OQ292_28265 [Chondrinema litorale]
MYKLVKIHKDNNLDTIKISSRPQAGFVLLLLACLAGLCTIPFTDYRNDFFSYVGVFFVFGGTLYYLVTNFQVTTFENKTNIKVRKGFSTWQIPFDCVSGGYTNYYKKVTRQSGNTTHFLDLELHVSLPENKNQWIRNGKANVFNYAFSNWGYEQQNTWEKLNEILDEKGIPNYTKN